MYDKNTSDITGSEQPVTKMSISEGFIFQSYPRFLNALSKGINCSFCKTKLSEKNIDKYEHEGGIRVDKYNPVKYWVYVTCSKCEYQWSWVKILRRFYK
jgi:hypothetical protein